MAGKGRSSAWTSSVAVSDVGGKGDAVHARPPNGHGPPSGASRTAVVSSVGRHVVQAASTRVPWIACGGSRCGWQLVHRPSRRRSPSRIRPAHGTIG